MKGYSRREGSTAVDHQRNPIGAGDFVLHRELPGLEVVGVGFGPYALGLASLCSSRICGNIPDKVHRSW